MYIEYLSTIAKLHVKTPTMNQIILQPQEIKNKQKIIKIYDLPLPLYETKQ